MATMTTNPEEPKKPGVTLDIQARLDRKSAEQAAAEACEAVADGIRIAVQDVLFGLTLTAAERALVEAHRGAQRVAVERGRAFVAGAGR